MPEHEPMPEAAPIAELHAEPVPSVASVEVPAAPAVDPALIQQIAGQDPMLAVILALVAVLGGGAAWKQWGKLSDQRHEQAMRRLDLEAEAAKIGAAQPPPCQAANAELTAKLAALEQRLGKAEHGLSLGGGVPDEIEARIAKLERSKRTEAATAARRAK